MPIHRTIWVHNLEQELQLLKAADKTVTHIIPEAFQFFENSQTTVITHVMIVFEDK